MRVAGIDPGAVPTMCLINHDLSNIRFYEDDDFAGVRKRTKNSPKKKGQRSTDALKVARVLHRDRPDVIFMEQVHCWPGYNIIAMDAFISAARLIEGVAAGMGIQVELVWPQMWQKAMHIDTGTLGKGGSLLAAQHLFPHDVHLFSRKKDHNRSDAAMLAVFGIRRMVHRMVDTDAA